MATHLVNAFTTSLTADCCGEILAELDATEITLDPDAVTCPGAESDTDA